MCKRCLEIVINAAGTMGPRCGRALLTHYRLQIKNHLCRQPYSKVLDIVIRTVPPLNLPSGIMQVSDYSTRLAALTASHKVPDVITFG